MSNVKYQVFVSSTFEDLKEERSEVIQELLNLNMIPAGMELFGSADESQWEMITKTIDESDYYILILGFKYGSIHPENNISYTQMEYEYAISKSIPIFTFIRKENENTKPNDLERDPSKFEKYNVFANLAKTRISSFWTDKDELIRVIQSSLFKNSPRYSRPGWVRNKVDNSKLTVELVNLSEENRKLKEDIKLLEERLVKRVPELRFGLDSAVPIKLFLDRKLDIPSRESLLIKEDIPKHLVNYISRSDIDTYNESIPYGESLVSYFKLVHKIKNALNTQKNPYDFKLFIENIGTAKASDIDIEITVPDFVLVIEGENRSKYLNGMLDEYKIIEWKQQELIADAQKKYDKDNEKRSLRFSLNDNSSRNSFVSGSGSVISAINQLDLNSTNRVWCEDNVISIISSSLLHTKKKEVTQFSLIPLIEGIGDIHVKIMCEELLKPIELAFPIEVSIK